jgi:hypothetical protein
VHSTPQNQPQHQKSLRTTITPLSSLFSDDSVPTGVSPSLPLYAVRVELRSPPLSVVAPIFFRTYCAARLTCRSTQLSGTPLVTASSGSRHTKPATATQNSLKRDEKGNAHRLPERDPPFCHCEIIRPLQATGHKINNTTQFSAAHNTKMPKAFFISDHGGRTLRDVNCHTRLRIARATTATHHLSASSGQGSCSCGRTESRNQPERID